MNAKSDIPLFVVVGYPNVGKTTVLSTLAEDDTAPISAFPGETRVCREYTVTLDGRPVFRLVDTPGFEEQREALAWMLAHQDENRPAAAFRDAHVALGEFPRECEIMKPLSESAAVLYVVDAARPVEEEDLAEMEILRLVGLPRVAVVNTKAESPELLVDWERELHRHFQAVRIFDAHKATFHDRLGLLRSLRSIRQDWEPMMDEVIASVQRDWTERIRSCAERIVNFLEETLREGIEVSISPGKAKETWIREAESALLKRITQSESRLRSDLETLFHHKTWRVAVEDYPELSGALDSSETWKIVGLSRSQLAIISAGMGAATGVLIDLKTLAASWGAGFIIGGAAGFGLGYFGSHRMVELKIPGASWMPRFWRGKKVGDALGAGVKGELLPRVNSNLPWGLLDRALLYARLVASWSHGRRDEPSVDADGLRVGFSSTWEAGERKLAGKFFGAVVGTHGEKKRRLTVEFVTLLQGVLQRSVCLEGASDVGDVPQAHINGKVGTQAPVE